MTTTTPRRLYVVVTGLSRRLVEADSPEAALEQYRHDKPVRPLLSVGPSDIVVREATPAEAAEFARTRGRAPVLDGQSALTLDDARKERKRSGKREAS